MKRLMKLLILLVVLAGLLAGYGAINSATQTQTVEQVEGTFDLCALTEDTLSGLIWADGETEYHFVREDGIWQKAGDTSFPVNQSALDALAKKIVALSATRMLEDVSSLADYGLDAPAFTVTAEGTDGTQVTYAMGDATPFADGYYVSASDQADAIYTVEDSLSDMFDKTLTQLAEMETMPEVENVTRLTVGDALDVVYLEESRTIDSTQHWYDAQTGEALDGEAVQELAEDAVGLAWNALIATSASDEELSAWTLDDAGATAITLFDGDEAARTLLIGAEDGEGSRYARLAGSVMVYTIDSDSVDALLSANVGTLWTRALVPLDYEELAQAVFTLGDGQTVTIAMQAEETDADAGDSGDAQESADAAGDAQTDEESADETLWQAFASLTGTARVNEEAVGDALLTVNVTSQSDVTAQAALYARDADTYLAVSDDGRVMLVDAAAVDRVVRLVRLAL